MTANAADELGVALHNADDLDIASSTIVPTKRSTEYSTENYKLELTNLPNKVNFHVVKNILERSFKLNPHKIKLGQGKAYISFKSEQERDDAIKALHQQEWKGRTLFAQSARPRDDLVAKKRKTQNDIEKIDDSRDTDQLDINEDSINDKVCPFWNTDYDKQIEHKDQFIRSILNIGKQVVKLCPNLRRDDPLLFEWAKKNEKICCSFDGVVRSSVLKGYRNKCEFNVSHNGEVGFMIGRYKNGSDLIRPPPRNCPILTDRMFDILDNFRLHLKNTSFKGFDLLTHEGNYRQITIRRNQKEEYLVIVDMHPQNATQSELDSEIAGLVEQLKKVSSIVSIFINISDRSSYNASKQSLKLVFGADALIEQLSIEPERPLKFRIGPASFFQINTSAAEVLYRSIIELAELDKKSFILDVGCGTGTIGLSLADKVNHVIGIEIVPEAIEDAKINASENNIQNVTFFAGRAEDLIGESLKIMRNKIEFNNIEDGEIVAIVDPPRVGFNNSFVKTLRASNIKKLIYVACDPKANTNLLTLCRPKSKAYQGEPFVPVRAKAFDLFPYTKFCELVVVYKRLSLV